MWVSWRLPVATRTMLALIVGLVVLGVEVTQIWAEARLHAAIGSLAGRTFVVDPGHGGPDPGAMRGDVEEEDIVLPIALQLRDFLQAAGATVVMTRTTDDDLSGLPNGTIRERKVADLRARAKLINDVNPDLFISVHANADVSSAWFGAQTFYRGNGTDVSKRVAEFIQSEIKALSGTRRDISPFVHQFILENTTAPAVTVEVGFISNPAELQKLMDPTYQRKMAWAIFVGVAKFYAQAPSRPAQVGRNP